MTDPFTAAARAESGTRYAVDWDTPAYYDAEDRQEAENFMAGAEWARDHLAAQEVTAAEVEAAAVVIWESYDLLDRAAIRDALSASRAARRDEEKS